MNYKIIPTQKFEKEIKRLVKKYPSLKNEYSTLISTLKHSPTMGTFIGDDCYKIRIAIASKNKGKSGAARVITHVLVNNKSVFLLTIYDKAEKSTISDKELKIIIKNLDMV